MEAPRIQHIARGTMHVTVGPADIRTIIGAGIAIGVCLPLDRGGGLIHLNSRLTENTMESILGNEGTWNQLRQFMDRLAELGHLYGSRAHLVGGADVLRMLYSPTHREVCEKWSMALSEFLFAHGVVVDQVIMLGHDTRHMSLSVPEGGLEVTLLGPGAEKSETGLKPRIPALLSPPPEEAGRDISVNIGYMRVSQPPHRLVTLLGSCVGVALYDTTTQIGGLAHVVLPRNNGSDPHHSRFADTAVPALVKALVQAGAKRQHLQAKLAGGATVLFLNAGSRLGRISEDNIVMVRQALEDARIPILGEDVGGSVGRRMVVDLNDFQVQVTPLGGVTPVNS